MYEEWLSRRHHLIELHWLNWSYAYITRLSRELLPNLMTRLRTELPRTQALHYLHRTGLKASPAPMVNASIRFHYAIVATEADSFLEMRYSTSSQCLARNWPELGGLNAPHLRGGGCMGPGSRYT